MLHISECDYILAFASALDGFKYSMQENKDISR